VIEMTDSTQYTLDQKQLDKVMEYLGELEDMLEDKIHVLRNVNPNPQFRKTKTAVIELLEELWNMQKDKCEICNGENGGVLGNENVIDDVIVCDYCSAELKGKVT